jgi:hypothetical protein
MNIIVKNAMSPWSAGVQNNPTAFRPMPPRGGNVRLMAGGPLISMNQLRGPWLGQAVIQVDHDKMLADLMNAENKISAVDSWQASQANVNAALGADAAMFQNLISSLASVADDETTVVQLLGSPDPANWNITTQQKTSADAYVRIASDLTDIVKRAQARPAPGTPVSHPPGSGVPAPATKPDYTMPIVVGGAAILLAAVFA